MRLTDGKLGNVYETEKKFARLKHFSNMIIISG